jgi:hypothetical protein
MSTIFQILLISIIILGLVMIIRSSFYTTDVFDECEEVTEVVTTTTTTNDGYTIVGNLVRQKDGNQYFVMDPVDNDKVWLNSGDDMYEDGAGKIWKLI